MPFCSNCGNNLPADSRFCPHCGKGTESAQLASRFFAQRDNVVTEEDLRAFIGPRAEKYLAKFRLFQVNGIENFAFTWHWPAFFFGFWWMLYRKLYLWSLAAFIIAFIPYAGFAGMIAWGITGNYIYYKHASSKILSLRQRHSFSELTSTISQIGGVNRWIVVVALTITLLGLISGILFSLFGGLSTLERIYWI